MTCSDCKHLNENDKCSGCLCGAKYYCNKNKCYVDGSSNSCENYNKSYARCNYTCNKIYEDGENYSNDATSSSLSLIFLIILIIAAIIINFYFV